MALSDQNDSYDRYSCPVLATEKSRIPSVAVVVLSQVFFLALFKQPRKKFYQNVKPRKTKQTQAI
jgi:hypothetical protein